MTEITDDVKNTEPEVVAKRHLVDPVAFFIAMIAGPGVIGLLGWSTLFIQAATLLGGPVYLVVGIPVMLVYMRRHRVAPYDWVWLALLAHVAVFLPLTLLGAASGGRTGGLEIFLIFGCFFAPLWGGISGVLYAALERDFYKQPL
ncbi:hypothetical protein [Phycobacter sp. K97]|uniref:hypothetical protein n=1 Tax=Phycobacter sedimenti TaxID=3133977 RepID=UPI00311E56D9